MAQQQPQHDDPFGAFGDDSDSDEATTLSLHPQEQQQQQQRDPSCGVLTFHSGTEQALLNHVQRAMEAQYTENDNDVEDPLAAAKQVLKLVDHYCMTRHWMMHVGDQKGDILKGFLREFCRANLGRLARSTQQRDANVDDDNQQIVTIVELGTYCGYSSILMVHTILEFIQQSTQQRQDNLKPSFRILSVDVDANHQAVAKKLVQLARLQDYVSFVFLSATTTSNNSHGLLVETLRRHSVSRIDFLFIDHDKDLYVPDLQQLEQSGWIQEGTHVAADNVVFFDIPYRSYMEQQKQKGILSSSALVMGQLEYVIPQEIQGGHQLQDGIELSVYKLNPSSAG